MITPKVSMVSGASGNDTPAVCVTAVLAAIKLGKYRQPVDAIRALYRDTLQQTAGDHKQAKRAVDPLKKKLPGVLFSGVFSARGDSNLIQHSGLLCADIDALSDGDKASAREKLIADPHVFALFESPTATGLKVVFAVQSDADKHAASFAAVRNHVRQHCGVGVDEACKNPERLCFVSDDPLLHLNTAAVPLPALMEEPKPEPREPKSKPADGPAVTIDLKLRAEIATRILGPINWKSEIEGLCTCPGVDLHSASDGVRDCRISIDGAPTAHCFHQSCKAAVDAANKRLRSEIGRAETSANITAAMKTDEDLVRQYGQPVFLRPGEGGGVGAINERFFAARFHRGGHVLFEPTERAFYRYSAETGLWGKVTDDSIREELSAGILDFGREHDLRLESKVTTSRTSAVLQALRGIAERRDAFARQADVVHVENGTIRFAPDGAVTLGDFRPQDYSRNRSPVRFEPDAECPRFLGEFLATALPADDINLLQRCAGLAVAGVNPAQRIVILDGEAATGKSTFATIIQRIVGVENCAQLRTDLLFQRFEIFRFVGKTLLLAPDTPGNFLNRPSASALKALVGGDPLTAEAKGSNAVFTLDGNFNVMITSNSRLRVRLDGDASAWRRRLIIVRFEKARPSRRIPNFADVLLRSEGPGILRWCLAGLLRAREEIAETGDLALSDRQKERVDALLCESDSVRRFVQECVAPGDGDLATYEAIEAYFRFCADCDWTPQAGRIVERDLPDLLLELWGTSKNHHVERGGKQVRGWAGVTLRRNAPAESITL